MAFHRAVKRTGLEDLRLHDTRHTFASYQAMSGVQGRGLQALLGRDPRMTLRYSHLSDAYLKAAEQRRLGQDWIAEIKRWHQLAPTIDRLRLDRATL